MFLEQQNKNLNKQESTTHWIQILSKWLIKIKFLTIFQM